MKNRHINKKHIFLIIILAIVIIFISWKYKIWNMVSIEYLRKYTERIRGLGFIGLILYLLVFTIGTILCLPSLPFAIFGGITYGTRAGIIYACIGDTLGMSVAFIIGRYIMRERIEKKLKDNKIFHEINDGVEKDGWRILILTRMVPLIPHWLQNYAYGITSVKFNIYVFMSLLSIIPGTAVWITAINTVDRSRGNAQMTMIYLGIATVVLVAISYLPKYIYKKKLLKSK